MKRKIILSLALTALLIAIFAISASAADPVETWDISNTSSDNVTAYLYNDGNGSGYYALTISGTGDMKNWTSYPYAPWNSADYEDYITSVTIEEGVSSIGDYAFDSCDSLTSVELPEGVSSIGVLAFFDCSSLTSIVIPEGVSSIGDYAFRYCEGLTSVELPEGVSTIGNYAFSYCNSLTSIVIPEGVSYIGDWAFSDCSSLTSIVIPESVTYIGDGAFYYCDSLTIYCEAESQPSGWNSGWNYSERPVVWGHSHSYDSATDLCVCGAKNNYVEKWNISNNVTAYLYNDENNAGYYTLTISGTGNMKNWTFSSSSSAPWYSSYRSKITSVTIEEGVTSIGNYAFYNCSSLTSIVIPESVTSIGRYAFSDCYSLTSIVIPEGVTSIGSFAFCDCSSLTSVELPEGVTHIGDYAFSGCQSLTSVELPEGVSSIGGGAFSGCQSLTSVELPESVTSIGVSAFGLCSSLTSVVIPEGVSSIGYSAFEGCSSLTIYCEAESQPSGWNSGWNLHKRPVVWGYEYETVYLEDIFTFKGYSFSANGGFAVGFAIDYDALAKYEAKTGKTLEIGVVFAGYDNLGGKQPLDQNGEAIELDLGMVKKAEITSLGYKYYDFMLTGFNDSIKDTKLVIAGYIFDGEAVKYVQANGMSDTVNGITYNEALKG